LMIRRGCSSPGYTFDPFAYRGDFGDYRAEVR
jgi:hypothetical protein